ncbi:MAG: nitroreductase family protein [Nitrospira sp.]|nr:nitroreductase family protein [Nitrospira sp.]
MDFFEVIDKRRSVRAFLEEPVEDVKVKAILEAANAAPSAGDLQAVEIYILRSEEKLRELAQAALGQYFIAEAPLALIFCAHPARSLIKYGMRGAELYCIQDAMGYA